MAHPSRFLAALLIGAALTPSALASARADGVRRLIDEGRIESAQAKCDRLQAHLSDTEAELREVCAEALFEKALEENSAITWVKFQKTWAGTSYVGAARDNEAAAALRALGNEAEEHQYQQFMADYKDTRYALAAEQLLADAAIRGVTNGKDAVRIAQMYPNHRNTALLIEKFLPSFLHMEMDGMDIKVSLMDGVSIPGPPPTGSWAARFGEEAYIDWLSAAEAHLNDIGASQSFIAKAKEIGFPPCQVPEAGWELGILVEVGSGKAFFPNGGIPECRGRPWPALLSYNGDRLRAISVSPEHTMRFPDGTYEDAFLWGPSDDETRMWTPGVAGDPIRVGSVIGQPVGNLFLLTPMAGGMPWYVNQGPPPSALPIPVEANSTDIPLGWTLNNELGPIGPGSVSDTEILVQSGALGGIPWRMPGGEVRVMSPLVQQLTGLYAKNPAFDRQRQSALPVLTGDAGPMGSMAVTVNEMSQANGAAVGRQLSGAGIPIRIWRAWEAKVGKGPGAPEIVFDGEIAGKPIKGLLDPMENGNGFRAFVWHRDARSQEGPEDLMAFQMDGITYVVWRGTSEDGAKYSEAIHFEDVGLIREFR